MWRASVEPGSRGRTGGFSFLEVLVATALFSVVMAGVYALYTTMQETFTRGEMKSDLHQNARVGLDRMVQELRMAGYDPENALGQVTYQRFNEVRAAAGELPVLRDVSEARRVREERAGDVPHERHHAPTTGGRLESGQPRCSRVRLRSRSRMP